MSQLLPLPPSIIKIKRKATDEPLEYLRIHEGKRQRMGEDYIFSRQPTPALEPATGQPTSRAIRRIKQPRGCMTQAPSTPSASSPEYLGSRAKPSEVSRPGTPLNADQAPLAIIQPRRFHISRSAVTSNPLGPASNASIRKRKAEPTVFVERRPGSKRPKSADGPGPSAVDKATWKKEDVSAKAIYNSAKRGDAQALKDAQSEPVRPRKKPGLAARSSIPPTQKFVKPVTIPNVVLPSGRSMQWDVSDEELVREMEAYTLQEIGKNIAEMETSKPIVIAPVRHSTPSKFKPKAPTARYLERHPEVDAGQNTYTGDDEPYEDDEEMDSDTDYVIDTYVRMHAREVGNIDTAERPSYGLLVIESEIDKNEFYCEDPESDDEEEDPEEDENAEDHYTADYPEDEVDSDDEYDRNPYSYRTRGATDLEEYDEVDATFSDDDDNNTIHPWEAKPWLRKPHSIVDDEYSGH